MTSTIWVPMVPIFYNVSNQYIYVVIGNL